MTKSILAVIAIVAWVLPVVSHAQEPKLSEVENRLIYSRAFETILWGSPMLASSGFSIYRQVVRKITW